MALSIDRAGALSGPSVSLRLWWRGSSGIGSALLVERGQDRVGRFARRRALLGEIGGQHALLDGDVDGALDGVRLVGEAQRMAQEHRDGEQRAVWIGDALAGDVGRRAVDRLV